MSRQRQKTPSAAKLSAVDAERLNGWTSQIAIELRPEAPANTASDGSTRVGEGALVAVIEDPAGEAVAIQLRYIDPDGEGSLTEPRRRLFALVPDWAIRGLFCLSVATENGTSGRIIIAEGIEDALSLMQACPYSRVIGIPGVAYFGKADLPEPGEVVVVRDGDEPGSAADKALRTGVDRLILAGHGGRIVMPPTDGDANDYQKAGEDLAGLLFPPVDDWLVPADDFSEQPAPIRWQVKRWLQSQALIMVHGPSGCGKTFLVLDMVLAVASKGTIPDWFGNKVRHGTVVYLAGEGHHGLRGK